MGGESGDSHRFAPVTRRAPCINFASCRLYANVDFTQRGPRGWLPVECRELSRQPREPGGFDVRSGASLCVSVCAFCSDLPANERIAEPAPRRARRTGESVMRIALIGTRGVP